LKLVLYYTSFYQTQSALAFIPMDPETGEILSGSMRGMVNGHGTAILLESAPTAIWPADMTAYLAETEPADVLLNTSDYLVAAIFGAGGAVSISPDFIGYGESYQTRRTSFVKETYAQAFTLGWLATREYIRSETNGCSELEAVATLSGFSEGGYAVIPGAFALREIGVRILGLYPAGAPLKPTAQISYGFELFASDSPPKENNTLLLWKILAPFSAYAYSTENPFLTNTGTGQIMLADEYAQGNLSTNALLWFDPPAQLGYGYVAFMPDVVTDVWSQDVRALYDEARLFGVTDGCTGYHSNTTDKICETILEGSLMGELASVDFPTIYCHSPEDEMVTFANAPEFPFSNPFVQEYTGVPGVNFLPPSGGHGMSKILCAISPILSLLVMEDSPLMNNPLENPPAECLALKDPPTETPSPSPTDSSAYAQSGSLFVLTIALAFSI
jgi:hypothetical protein